MTQIYTQPQLQLHTLNTADGSATYISPGSTHTLTVGVNYPIEVTYRSDEDPESTNIEVSVRPHNGVAMVRERHVEELVRRTLQSVVIGYDTPRTCLQITLQVVAVQADESLPGGIKSGGQGEGWLDLLVGCINASIAACLDASVRMRGMAGAVLLGVLPSGEVIISPNVLTRKQCTSLHAFAYNTRSGCCILMESQGTFNLETWQVAEQLARHVVCGDDTTSQQNRSVLDVFRDAVQARTDHDKRWAE